MGDGSSSRADGGEKVAVSPSSSSGATPDASTDQQSDGATAPAADRGRLLPRAAVVEERGRGDDAAERGCGGSPVTPAGTPGAPADVPRGCCPVYVGAERRRFVVPTAYLGAPAFRRLLEKAEEEFGFHYHGGALTIPCDTEALKHILLVTDRQVLAPDADGTVRTPSTRWVRSARPNAPPRWPGLLARNAVRCVLGREMLQPDVGLQAWFRHGP